MNRTMTGPELHLARRIIGLRGTSFKATKNSWRRRVMADWQIIMDLQEKGHVAYRLKSEDWFLTNQGVQQLKQQIGEFTFKA